MAMGYQTGTVGPISYPQDNSGNANDIDNTIIYTPEQWGAPQGSQIIPGTVQITQYVSRGLAYVHNETVSPAAIQFDVYTQAANDSWFFGHHSGAITVATSFQWFYNTNTALLGGEGFFMQEVPGGEEFFTQRGYLEGPEGRRLRTRGDRR
jgi:hypothetical protein